MKNINHISNEAIEKLSRQESLIQKAYKNKCLYPDRNDILNCIYELQYEGLASLIHQYWNEDDQTLGEQLRKRFKQDFFEVAHIEVLEEIE